MSELKVYSQCYDGTDGLFYLKSEADKAFADLEESHKMEVGQLLMEIEEIVKGAISMFRLSDNCRGLDLKSPLGMIANTAFKHWCFVESIQNKNQQLQEDKERLLHNNHHLLDEVERLKEDVADARQKACEFQEIINEKEAQLNHANYKRCEAMAERCETNVYDSRRKPLCDMDDHEGWQHDDEFWQRWHKRWLELAEHYKEMAK